MDCTILSSRFQRSSIQWQSEITSLASKKDSWTAWIQGTCFWKACLPGDGFWVRQMSGESWRICSWQARLTEWEVRAESSLLADFKSRRDDDAVLVSITIHLLLLRTQYHLRFAFLKCMFFFSFLFLIATMDTGLHNDLKSGSCQLYTAKKNIWLHIEVPKSKSVHDLNLLQAYHNAVRLCWFSKAIHNRLQKAPASQGCYEA